MAGNVVWWNGVSRLDCEPDGVLERAAGELETVVVIGYDKTGAEYFASSAADGGTVLWLLERTKSRLLGVIEG
jgi:hypothetical protein